jgi:hypothetical protein
MTAVDFLAFAVVASPVLMALALVLVAAYRRQS